MYFIYAFMILIGALPLTMYLIKRKQYKYILQNGVKTVADIQSIKTVRTTKGPDIDHVTYMYLPANSNRYYSGILATKKNKYKRTDQLEIYYLPERPEKNAFPPKKGELWMFLFVLAVFVFVIYACIKIDEMVGDQKIYFNP